MGRRVYLPAPFTGGMVTDRRAHRISLEESAFAQDLLVLNGIAQQRRGWTFHGGTGIASVELCGVHRAKYVLAAATRTMTLGENGKLYIHLGSGAATDLGTLTTNIEYLPRCMWRDELILCAQDGVTPLRRYAGADSTPSVSDGVGALAAGEAVITAISLGAAADSGSFVVATDLGGEMVKGHFFKVLESTTTTLTLDGLTTGDPTGCTGLVFSLTGKTFPCVSIYSAGTMSVSSSVATGQGTKWVDSAGISATDGGSDGFIVVGGTYAGADFSYNLDSTPANTSLSNVNVADTTVTNYHILRQCPFKDAASHKGSFWGTGTAQYANRVYVSPPDWNPSAAPGDLSQIDVLPAGGVHFQRSDAGDFMLDFIDVPGPYDGDQNVAILSSAGPLLVLKRKAVHGIFGSYPNFSQEMIADGAGCIDIRSAFSSDAGQFWASEVGVMTYWGGQVVDLTSGKINREWRSLTEDFNYTTDRCVIGQASGHLVVRILTAAGTVDRTYVCELDRQNPWESSWHSRFTNAKARYFFAGKVPDEAEQLLWVSDDEDGDVMDLAPALNGSGSATDGDATEPRLQAHTGSRLMVEGDIDLERRLTHLNVHANLYDTGAAGSTQLNVDVDYWGGLRTGAEDTNTVDLGTIDSTDNDVIEMTRLRPNVSGRHHQIKVDVSNMASTTTRVEIAEMVAEFEPSREGP